MEDRSKQEENKKDYCCTFAMSLMILLVLICSTKVSEKSDMAKS